MSKKYQTSLCLFRRDYRLDDNTALIAACQDSELVVPVFCFDPNQYDQQLNKYFGDNSFRFLIESLVELNTELESRGSKLHFLQGNPWEEIKKLALDVNCQAVFFNRDYTPYANDRDQRIKVGLEAVGVELHTFDDVLLNAPGSISTGDGGVYKVFTPFSKKSREIDIPKPVTFNDKNLTVVSGKNLVTKDILKDLMPGGESSRQVGGRSSALEILKNLKDLKNYSHDRDFPSQTGTSELSAHLKFGTISVREFYHQISGVLGTSSGLVNQLYWRDFYMHILSAYPYVLGDEFQEKYQGMEWVGLKGWDSADLLAIWKDGKTGFPIVDAGMRQLKSEGWMHNRVRMIVASFLTKDMHLDWREGERHFANYLVDYDPANNNGGWQWAASTGTDAQPYFRIFNPWSSQKKFDPDCLYIKKYLPELQSLDPKIIHGLDSQSVPDGIDYPNPILDHSKERLIALEQYQSSSGV